MRRFCIVLAFVVLSTGYAAASSHCEEYGVSNCVEEGTVSSGSFTVTPSSDMIVAETAYVAEAPLGETNDWQTVTISGGTTVDPGPGEVPYRSGTLDVPVDGIADGRYVMVLWGCPSGAEDPSACGWMRPRTFEKDTGNADTCDTTGCSWIPAVCGGGQCGPGQMQERYQCTDADCDDGQTRCSTSAQCQATVNVRVNMSERTGITRSEYESSLTFIADQLGQYGVDVNFAIVEWSTFDPSETSCHAMGLDETPSQEVDIVLCAGGWDAQGNGGYWGWESSRIGHNTTTFARSAEGSNEEDVHTSTHEYLHYFGIGDLYGWPSTFPMQWMDSDIMSVAVWREDPDPTLYQDLATVTQFNVDRVAASSEPGRSVVAARMDQRNVYPGYMHLRISNQTDIALDVADGETTCTVEEIANKCVDRGSDGCNEWKRLFELGQHPDHIPDDTTSYSTDSDGVLTLEMRRFARNRGIRLQCGTASGETTTWLPWALLDTCFVGNGMETPSTCRFACREDASRENWCAFTGATDIEGVDVIQKRNQLEYQ